MTRDWNSDGLPDYDPNQLVDRDALIPQSVDPTHLELESVAASDEPAGAGLQSIDPTLLEPESAAAIDEPAGAGLVSIDPTVLEPESVAASDELAGAGLQSIDPTLLEPVPVAAQPVAAPQSLVTSPQEPVWEGEDVEFLERARARIEELASSAQDAQKLVYLAIEGIVGWRLAAQIMGMRSDEVPSTDHDGRILTFAERVFGAPMTQADRFRLLRRLETELPEAIPHRKALASFIALTDGDRFRLESEVRRALRDQAPYGVRQDQVIINSRGQVGRGDDLAMAREQAYVHAGPALRSPGGTLGYAIEWALGHDKYERMQGAELGDTIWSIISVIGRAVSDRNLIRERIQGWERPLEVPGAKAHLESDKVAPAPEREPMPAPDPHPAWRIKP